MILTPHSDYVLCEQLTKATHEASINGFTYMMEDLPTYKILKVSSKLKDDFHFKVGDVIITNSEPTKAKTDDQTFFLIKSEYVAGKLSE